jgi:hypothetical protein
MATGHRWTYTSPRFWILLIGVIIVIISSFAPLPIPVDAFKLGVGISFASFLG